MSRDEAVRVVADYFRPRLQDTLKATQDVVAWGEKNFYVPETEAPIQLEPVQKVILRCAFDREFAAAMGCPKGFQEYIYSTVKKSGKTTIAAMVARWIGETWGSHNEIFAMANDLEQARGRVYAKALESMELDPNYDRSKRVLPSRWRIIERDALNLANGSVLRAVSSDYKGEAGSNPTATFWSELWGYTTDASRRMWAELTPVPTRPRSIRWVETYAGYENESTLLLELWERATKPDQGGRRLTRDDLLACGIVWPYPDEYELPLYVNARTRMFAYIDQGPHARRMPWQTPDYYVAQAGQLRPNEFDRLHNNEWTSPTSEFIPVEWWDRLEAGKNDNPDLPPLDATTPCVIAADAAVTSDCCALVLVSRNPHKPENVALRASRIFTPPPSTPENPKPTFDYDDTIVPTIEEWCKAHNVVCIVYDAYQLHQTMRRLNRELMWCQPFDQGNRRLKADKQLYDLIRDKRLLHHGDRTMREHISACGAKTAKDEDTKLRIVKRSEQKKIDGVVALSMAADECLRLNLT